MTLAEDIVAVRRSVNRLLSQRLALETDRPFLQLRLLCAVTRGNVATQTDAAEHLLIDAAAVCRLVDRLEEDGLVKRREGKDRRSGRLQATSAGRAEAKPLEEALAWLDALLREQLGLSEYRALVRLLAKLQGGLEVLAVKPRPRAQPVRAKRASAPRRASRS